ncbi:hypothetical protein D8Y22_15985 [Salinadaptatus halalkaliphilus]|uniref:Small CPxCG-related zinc finger protein n=1 Tax=Salinadaptatus halalkaliphilus TaxID=2419781 RepID=A0A4S3TJT9_9EURY|nr:hypothetical protein [Salinadaptatus halalkaliphilus]THE63830.1 hypothetical protein D8Y22_15985 [Salinadaptatus halalkaliphilus]
MWPSRNASESVTCLACGKQVSRSMAREYDKHGDRWDRTDKRFEYCCKSCHDDLCHYPRDELEALLIELDAGETDRDAFLSSYLEIVEERYGTLEEEY